MDTEQIIKDLKTVGRFSLDVLKSCFTKKNLKKAAGKAANQIAKPALDILCQLGHIALDKIEDDPGSVISALIDRYKEKKGEDTNADKK